MPTVIDSLIVELNLDPKNFTEGQKSAVSALRALEAQTQRTSSNVSASGASLVAFFRSVQHPIAALKQRMESLTLSTVAPRQHLTELASQGRRTGTSIEAGAKQGAIGLRALGVAGLVAFSAFETFKKTLEGAAASANQVFGTSVLAAAGGAGIRRFSAISQALSVHGNAPEEQTQAWMARWRQMQNLQRITGHGMEGVYSQGAQLLSRAGIDPILDSAEQVQLKTARFFAKISADEAVSLGSTIGLTAEHSLALRANGEALERNIAEEERKHAITEQNSQASKDLNQALSMVEKSWGNLTRIFYDSVDPMLTKFLTWFSNFLDLLSEGKFAEAAKQAGSGALEAGKKAAQYTPPALIARGGIRLWNWATGRHDLEEQPQPTGTPGRASSAVPNSVTPGTTSAGDPRGMIPVIRAAAIRNGVDPDVAVRVARSEGLGTPVGDRGTSFGSFQLHVGGGEGDRFRRETGLDPSDPKNEVATIDYAMRRVRETGWIPYHGAARAGIGPREGIGTPLPEQASTKSGSAARGESQRASSLPAWISDPVTGGFRAGFDAVKQAEAMVRFKSDVVNYVRNEGARSATSHVANDNRTHTINVGDVNVHTQATNPAGIGEAVTGSVKNMVAMSNSAFT
jgi:hypothetical protein